MRSITQVLVILMFIGFHENKAQVTWKAMTDNGTLPSNAISGGKENGQTQYVCRAKLGDGGYHPGKLFKSSSGWVCNCAGGDNEVVNRKFDVLVQYGSVAPSWQTLSQINNLSSVGVSTTDGHGNKLYACRYEYYDFLSNKGRHIGKLWKGQCEFGYGGKAIRKDDAGKIQILVISEDRSTRDLRTKSKARIEFGKDLLSGVCSGNRNVFVKNLTSQSIKVKVKKDYRGFNNCNQNLSSTTNYDLKPNERKYIGEKMQNCAASVGSISCREMKYTILN